MSAWNKAPSPQRWDTQFISENVLCKERGMYANISDNPPKQHQRKHISEKLLTKILMEIFKKIKTNKQAKKLSGHKRCKSATILDMVVLWFPKTIRNRPIS